MHPAAWRSMLMVSKQAGRSSRWMPPRSNNNNKSNNKTSYPYVRRALESVGRKERGFGAGNDELSTPPPLERFLAYYPRLIRSCNVRSCNCNVDYRKGRLYD
ncbi:unnamed protein product [Sphagnum jensenii]|uniref:Uncharacterized protein n=1 Tax=Sphagnum jensenii TaxID=128206 RepID=A0ABP1AUS2_9BRYO